MDDVTAIGHLAQDLQLKRKQVEVVIALLDAGETPAFIGRFQRPKTMGLEEPIVREIRRRWTEHKKIDERRQIALLAIETQGKLTDELKSQLLAANAIDQIEDLFARYKPKRSSLANLARQKGLESLAESVWKRDASLTELDEAFAKAVDPEKQLNTAEDVKGSVESLLVEWICETPEIRAVVRNLVVGSPLVSRRASGAAPAPATIVDAPATNVEGSPAEAGSPATEKTDVPVAKRPPRKKVDDAQTESEFKPYYHFREALRGIAPHKLVMLIRGQRTNHLSLDLAVDAAAAKRAALEQLKTDGHPWKAFIEHALATAVEKHLLPSLKQEVLADVGHFVEGHVAQLAARNLRNLAMQPPLNGQSVIAIDPGYRGGCKVAVLGEHGDVLEDAVIFPNTKRRKKKKSKEMLDPSAHAAMKKEVEANTQFAAEIVTEAPAAEAPAPVMPADSYYRMTSEGDEPISDNPESLLPDAGVTSEASVTAPGSEYSITAQPEPAATPEVVATPPISTLPDPILTESVDTTHDEHSEEVADDSEDEDEDDDDLERSAEEVSQEWAEVRRQLEGEKKEGVPSLSKRERAKLKIREIVERHGCKLVAIGNGPASRETEEFVVDLIAGGLKELTYTFVQEVCANQYATSPQGREELPTADTALRAAVSIGRRLLDPLSEYTKLDPVQLGNGLTPFEVSAKVIRDHVAETLESCVHGVGVDLNRAHAGLLKLLSGLNADLARAIVKRRASGPFRSREQLLEVPGITPEIYRQVAGFVRVTGGDEPLDATWVHPERYVVARRLIEAVGHTPQDLTSVDGFRALAAKIRDVPYDQLAQQFEVEPSILFEVIECLLDTGRDIRDEQLAPALRKGATKLTDLVEGTRLQGKVLNVVDFGLFIDIGIKESGLVHISQLANRFIRNPHEMYAVGDTVTVWVLKIDLERRRVSLSMIDPVASRQQQASRPPRGEGRGHGQAPGGEGDTSAATGQRETRSRGGRPGGQNDRQPRSRDERGRSDDQGRGGDRPREGGGRRNAGGGRPGQQTGNRFGGSSQRSVGPRIRAETPVEPKPPVQLSEDALSGKGVLHTFGELKALFEAKKTPKAGGESGSNKS